MSTQSVPDNLHSTEFKKDFLCVLFLFILALLFFWRMVFLGEYCIGGDIINQFYPWKQYLVSQTWQDRIPLWNPYTFGGNPFAANYQVGMWYPLDFIFFFIPIADAFRLSIVLHFFLAGLFMFILSRHFKLNRVGSLMSAIIFTYGGFLITRLSSGNYTLVTTYPWIPIIYYLFDKLIHCNRLARWMSLLVLLAIALACQILGGHPQPAYYTLLMLSLYAVFIAFCNWKDKSCITKTVSPILFFFISVLLAFGLSAIQLLPSKELSLYSASRAGGASYDFATFSSLGLRHLLMFFAPTIYGTSIGDTYWLDYVGYVEILGYISVSALFLVGFGLLQYKNRTVKYFCLMIIASLFLALGNNNPLYPLAFYTIPGLRMFRCPGRWVMMIQFGLAFLAGQGIHSLLEKEYSLLQLKKYIFKISAVGCLLLLGWVYLFLGKDQIIHWILEYQVHMFAKFNHMILEQAYNTISYEAVVKELQNFTQQYSIGMVFYLIGFGLFFLIYKQKLTQSWNKFIWLALVLIELWNFGFGFLQTTDKTDFLSYFKHSDAIQFLQKDKDPYRIITLDDVLSWMYTTEKFEYRPNRLMIYKIPETRGYDPTILRHYSEYLNLLQNKPPEFEQGGMAHVDNPYGFNSTLISLLNVRYLSTFVPITTFNIFSPVFQGSVLLYKNKDCFPLALYVPKAIVIPDKSDRFKEMQKTSFAPKDYVILEQKPKDIPDDLFVQNTTTAQVSQGNQVTLSERYSDYSIWKVDLSQNGFVFFSEIWYPGWKVFANGKEIPIYKADHCFRAVYLPKGTYTLEMKFLSESYYWGRKLSELSIALCLILLAYWAYTVFLRKEKNV